MRLVPSHLDRSFAFLVDIGAPFVHNNDISSIPDAALIGFFLVAGLLVLATVIVIYVHIGRDWQPPSR